MQRRWRKQLNFIYSWMAKEHGKKRNRWTVFEALFLRKRNKKINLDIKPKLIYAFTFTKYASITEAFLNLSASSAWPLFTIVILGWSDTDAISDPSLDSLVARLAAFGPFTPATIFGAENFELMNIFLLEFTYILLCKKVPGC